MAFFLITNEGYNSLDTGIANLTQNLSAIETIESMINIVELDETVHSVGITSWPNMLGEMEFDASIMNGETLDAGSVGALKYCLHPISVAKAVMDKSPHALLVGEGARLFADEHGFGRHLALGQNSLEAYIKWLADNQLTHVDTHKLTELSWRTADPQKAGGTVAALIQDNHGNLSAGVSTSGWAWKHPGRLGDSPVIGAGIYADQRYGAAGCIGHGEVAIRTTAAKSIVQHMEYGLSVAEAVLKVAKEIQRMPKKFKSSIGLHAVSKTGEPYLLTLGDGVKEYFYWQSGMSKAEKRPTDLLLDL